MRIFVCGASGFIGQAIAHHLVSAGHDVVRGVRKPTLSCDITIDFSTDTDIQKWSKRLTGIDVVVNAVGIISESPSTRFEYVHYKVPAALFAACVTAGVKRIVQISALGAEYGDTSYFKTKYAADQMLMSLPIEWQILRPSLVYGTEGVSASMFRMLASLPVIPIPELGQATFQPIHIDDLVEGLEHAIDPLVPAGQQINMVGRSPVTYRAMLESYRRSMGFEEPLYLTIPAILMGIIAKMSAVLPGTALTPENWKMLQAGSSGDSTNITRLLGRRPTGLENFIPPSCAELLRLRALSAWRTKLLQYALALVWIATACISAFVYPMVDSLALLKHVGLVGGLATTVLYGSSVLDLAMGVACIKYPSRALWGWQAMLVIGYTAIIAIAIPAFLTHPFGPVIKNLPILAILFILFAESKAWTT